MKRIKVTALETLNAKNAPGFFVETSPAKCQAAKIARKLSMHTNFFQL
jgi:hypothetical protein